MYVKDPARLRRRRKDKGLAQQQLAALVGCTQQYISLLESGRDRDCGERVAEKIARWLDVDLEDFFEERTVTPAPASAMPAVTTSSRVAGDAA